MLAAADSSFSTVSPSTFQTEGPGASAVAIAEEQYQERHYSMGTDPVKRQSVKAGHDDGVVRNSPLRIRLVFICSGCRWRRQKRQLRFLDGWKRHIACDLCWD